MLLEGVILAGLLSLRCLLQKCFNVVGRGVVQVAEVDLLPVGVNLPGEERGESIHGQLVSLEGVAEEGNLRKEVRLPHDEHELDAGRALEHLPEQHLELVELVHLVLQMEIIIFLISIHFFIFFKCTKTHPVEAVAKEEVVDDRTDCRIDEAPCQVNLLLRLLRFVVVVVVVVGGRLNGRVQFRGHCEELVQNPFLHQILAQPKVPEHVDREPAMLQPQTPVRQDHTLGAVGA